MQVRQFGAARFAPGRKPGRADVCARRARRRLARAVRRAAAVALGPVLAAGTSLVPAVAVTAAVAAGGAAAAVAAAPAASASAAGSVLILASSVNGGASSAEAAAAEADGYSVTVESASAWDGETTEAEFSSLFSGYAAVIIGDPSSGGTCSATANADAAGNAADWEPEITGNVAVLGTAPALAGSAGKALMQDAIAYAASPPPDTSGTTGLYISLNCDYASSSDADTDATLLNSLDGGGFDVTGQVSSSGPACGDSGLVSTWEAETSGSFAGLTGAALAASSWGSACPVQETFNTWPANFTPVAFDPAASPADFTASDGVAGQPYVLAGTPAPTPATLAESATTGGSVPHGSTLGGSSSASHASQGIQGTAAAVNTETGDFSQSDTDVSIPGFGPGLDFTRTYDAQSAQAQKATGIPGPLGYGWTDDWASSVTTSTPIPGDIYALDGLGGATGTGDGLTAYAQNGDAPAAALMADPGGVLVNNGNVYWSDTGGNRVEEVPGSSGTQWGISMTAGDVYTIAGSYTGQQGSPGSGGQGDQVLLTAPTGLAMDSAGDLYIADSGIYRVEEMTPSGALSLFAGNGSTGTSGDGGAATSAHLDDPTALSLYSGNVYIADAGNNRIQEVAASTGTQWGQSMTAGDIYTVAGSPSGTSGQSANGTTGSASLLNGPQGISVTSAGFYVADTGNCRVVEFPKSAGTQWGISMDAGDEYTVAGRNASDCGDGANDKAATASDLDDPVYVTAASSNLYIANAGSSNIKEVAGTSHTEFSQSMTADYIYDIAGTDTAGNSGNGGLASSARLDDPDAVTLDSSGDLYLADAGNNQVREVSAATGDIALYAGSGQSLASAGDGGPAVNGELVRPGGEVADALGDLYIADTGNNRVQEIAASTHVQWGIAMTGGDVYTIAGSAAGLPGDSGDGGPAASALLDYPEGLAFDAAGNLLIVDQFNNQVRMVAAAAGTSYGQSVTAGDIYAIAGTGAAGTGSDGVAATAGELDHPFGIAVDSGGDVYIADKVNNRIQEIYEGGQSFGQSMTKGDIYTVAGSSAGTEGDSGDGGAATGALMNGPEGVTVDAAGNLYIADTQNEQVREVRAATGAQWNRNLTKNDIYTIAGSAAGTAGSSGDTGPAASSQLYTPVGLDADSAGDLYIADGHNDRIQEIAAANGAQWGTNMEYGDIYTVAGQPGSASDTGNGGPASMATIYFAMSNSTDSDGDLYIGDWSSGQLREIPSASPAVIDPPPGVAYPSALYPAPGSTLTINGTSVSYPGGITVTQPGGAQISFWPQNTGGGCTLPEITAGGYCTDSVFAGASLTETASSGVPVSWTFSPSPGSGTDTYSATTGQLTAVTDPAGDTLSVYPDTPAPGAATATTGTVQPVTTTAVTCPAAVGSVTTASCQTIEAATGRALVISSDAAGQVTSVTDPLGRQWTYAYNSAGDLTAATSPTGNTTSYGYDTGNPDPLLTADLTSITSPDAQPGYSGPDADSGQATTIAYNTAGQVTSQTDPMGYQTTYSYCASGGTADCLSQATGDGYVTTTDPDGNQTIDGYLDGTLTSTASYTGTLTAGTLTSQTADNPDTAIPLSQSSACPGNTDGSLLDTATFDGDGNQTTTCYNADGDAATVTTPSGGSTPSGTQTTTTGYTAVTAGNQGDQDNCDATSESGTTCTAAPGPSPVTAGGAITPPSSAPPDGLTWTLYDTDGNQLYTTTGVYSPSGSYEYSQTSYQLYAGNTVILPGASTATTCTHASPSPSLPCATINPDGVVTQLGYDAQGDQTSTATPDGNAGGQLAETTDSYDADGEQLTQTAPDGNITGANAGNYTTTTAYDADSQETSVTQGNGTGYTDTPRTTSYTYDGDGNQTTVTDPRGYTTTTAYNADDEATLVTDPDGNATLTCYDGDGNVAQTVPAVGVAANSLTAASCPAAFPAGYTTRLASDATVSTFSAGGDMTRQATPAPAGQTGYETTTWTYDADGNQLTETAPPAINGGPNQVTSDTYTSAGQIAAQTTGYGTTAASTVSYCYDPDGNQTSVIYADGNTSGTAACSTTSPWTVTATPQANYQTTYLHDSAGDLTSSTTPKTTAAPSGATTTATYDAVGNMLTSEDPDGITTTWTYTPLNQIATIGYSGSSAHSVSYIYDASGNKTSMTDATGTSSYVFDSFGELASAQNGAGQTTAYAYNADGLVTGITYPLPSTATWATSDRVSYGYDQADEMNAVTDFNGNMITIGDTADGLPSSVALGSSGDTITTSYDPSDSPSAITLKNSTSTLQSFTYSDAPAGEILSETDTPSSSNTPADYTYDGQGQVTSDTPGTGTAKDYTFDASGNLTTLPTGATGSYNDGEELTSSTLSGGTSDYTYNADGEQLSSVQGSTTQSSGIWNGAGELTAYENTAGSMTAATYDGNGMRASAQVTPSVGSGVTQNYLWDGDNLLMDSDNAYIYVGGTAPIEQVSLSSGTVTYLDVDALGSVRSSISSAGALTASTSYDAWGNPSTSGGLTATTPFGYAGGYTDPDGLIYLINRYYDPSTGQFTSVDPELSTTLEPYSYAAGDPVIDLDPTGLAHVDLSGAAKWAYRNINASYDGFGDDCTDFVSRALVNGGNDAMTVERPTPQYTTDNKYWFLVWFRAADVWSDSWSVARDLYYHLLDRGSHTISPKNAIPGEIIFANWNGNKPSGIDHAGIITGMKNGVPQITQHSPSQHTTLTYWLKTGGSDVHVWILEPKAG